MTKPLRLDPLVQHVPRNTVTRLRKLRFGPAYPIPDIRHVALPCHGIHGSPKSKEFLLGPLGLSLDPPQLEAPVAPAMAAPVVPPAADVEAPVAEAPAEAPVEGRLFDMSCYPWITGYAS